MTKNFRSSLYHSPQEEKAALKMRRIEYYQISADQGRLFRKAIEWVTVIAAVLLGAQLVFHGYAPYEHTFMPVSWLLSSTQWGLLLLTLALGRTVILIVNGRLPKAYSWRQLMSVSYIVLMWLPISGCFWWGFVSSIMEGTGRIYIDFAFANFALGIEMVVFYAHATFVYINRRVENDG